MYIDTHAHLYLDQFTEDQDAMIQRCKTEYVEKIFLPNIDLDTIEPMESLCNRHQGMLFPMIGLHPCSVGENYLDVLDTMEKLLDTNEYVGIGETGIDLYWDTTYEKQQEASFRIQINWARERQLPVIIHSRNSLDETIRIIGEEQDGSLKGIFHCFTEDFDYASRIMDLGFLMGIGGVVTFKKSNELRDCVRKIPAEYLVLETDAPYLTPHPHRGKRNESSYLPLIAQVVAEARSLSVEELANSTSEVANHLFLDRE